MSKKKILQLALLLLSLLFVACPVLADVNVSVNVTPTTLPAPPTPTYFTKTLVSIPVALSVFSRVAMMLYGSSPEEKTRQFLITLAIIVVGIFVLSAIGGL